MAKFFIERQKFSWALATILMLTGLLSIMGSPLAHYTQSASSAAAFNAIRPATNASVLLDIVDLTLISESLTDAELAQTSARNKSHFAVPVLRHEMLQGGWFYHATSPASYRDAVVVQSRRVGQGN